MITKEKFIDLVDGYKNWNDRINEVCDAFGVDIFEADWIEYTFRLFCDIIDILFEDGVNDMIENYIFNDTSLSISEDDNTTKIDSANELWEIVKDKARK